MLTEPVVISGRVHDGFNPASPREVWLFHEVLAGENLLYGFHNDDVRVALYGETENGDDRRRQSHTVGRMLSRLHVRGLIVRATHSHRCHVSIKGYQVLGAAVQLYHHGIPVAMVTAA